MSNIFAFAAPTDLRLGYNGLYGLVRNALGRDPMTRASYLFVNRRRTACKILRHDGTGMTIFMKRLDRKQRFAPLWARAVGGEVELTDGELALFIEGSQQVGYMELVPRKVSI
jgi:transposase